MLGWAADSYQIMAGVAIHHVSIYATDFPITFNSFKGTMKIAYGFDMKHRNKGFTLVEVLIAAMLLVIAILAIFSAVLWGKQYVKQSQFVVLASNLGRNELEEIKAFGVYNADTVHTVPPLNVMTVIHDRLQSPLDPSFDTETKKYTLSSDSNIIVFESIVYLHGTATTDIKFSTPIVSYQTQMVVGGI